MGQISPTSIAAQLITPTASSKARNPPTCRCRFRPNMSWPSTSRLRKVLASWCRRRCSPAQTSLSNKRRVSEGLPTIAARLHLRHPPQQRLAVTPSGRFPVTFVCWNRPTYRQPFCPFSPLPYPKRITGEYKRLEQQKPFLHFWGKTKLEESPYGSRLVQEIFAGNT